MARFFKPQKKKNVEQKHQLLAIQRLDHHGDGVGYWQKKPVFVPGTLPGEQVLVQLTEQKRQYARAKLIKLDQRAETRIEPACPLYQQCGGCSLQHLSHQGQVAHKRAVLTELIEKFAGDETVELSDGAIDSPWQYRRRARISLKVDNKGALTMGFRARQSNAIVDVDHCPVLSEPLNQLLASLRPCLDGLRGRRILGHVDLIEADNGCIASLRTTKALHPEDRQALQAWAELTGCMLYWQQAEGPLERVVGEPPYYESLQTRLYFQPGDFIQVNAAVNQQMVAQALNWLELASTDVVLDLFCGLGNFSIPMAKRAKTVIGVEGVEAMVSHAQDNAKVNQVSNAQFYQADLNGETLNGDWTQHAFDKILLDPARAGAAGVMDFVAQSSATHIVYVSCNPATLARDSRVLLAQGYQLTRLSMLDMFPQTGHLESMALFRR
ncbi:23S rRNA (uracil(1939)-C(5))-methyltransferase RlmD [Salinivibrio proteolyticus]|uniref:23S rRNA (uracil(1939)-C(5))-methyltransferase RlmD n=1 Tax=Salinivibrio proteolyticus TaxID=334715 RepID=UPI0009890359|nr:23S rRNA (uracil(1939)-C(5))-methyltransferase RlmD [Salinivibrio proteolyticus]OOF31397.1 23S rRNA (uracil(1939)-C(5))-methyltransferase [Salinivibrio proteolyticus]